jgi:hypothetical protein
MQASIYFNPQNQHGRSLFSKMNSGCGFIGQAHRKNALRSSYWTQIPKRALPCRGQRARLQAREINAPLQTRRNHREAPSEG